MFVIFGFLLMIAEHLCCTNDQNFEMKSVAAQQNVTLTCPRKIGHKENLFWIRIISGHQPEFLGGTYGFDYDGVHQTPHFTTKQEPETFILNIHQSQISDTGLYYCIGTETLEMSFVRGVFLMVKDLITNVSTHRPQSSISGIVQAPPSAAVHPGESVSLQCSVLSDSEKKTCSEDYRVHWFRAGSHQSHPDFIYTHGANAECGHSSHKCFYSFSKKVSVSDAGTYYCAVAACGEVMFGNGAKLDIKVTIYQKKKKKKKKKVVIMMVLMLCLKTEKRKFNFSGTCKYYSACCKLQSFIQLYFLL
uniref:Ig-like domain-containing protein n=1 Tax=Salarias fasciatus TaxID=181472 RepID=A0A672IQE9_SALFA